MTPAPVAGQGLRLGPRPLYVRLSPIHGRGVFTAVDRPAGAVLEVSPVLVVPAAELPALRQTRLYGYYYQWPGGAAALALGYGSLYNHSYRAVARFELDVPRRLVVFTAVVPLHRDQEITINYNGDPEDGTAVWFDRTPGANGRAAGKEFR